MIAIHFTSWELIQAAIVGVIRQTHNLQNRRSDVYGAPQHYGWQMHFEGAIGEAALAKCLARYWLGPGRFRGDDVSDQHVRFTHHDDGCLILHPADPDDKVFWLVTGHALDYVIRGWIEGRDGKHPTYWKEPVNGRPAFFVPQEALHPPKDRVDNERTK